MSIRYQGS